MKNWQKTMDRFNIKYFILFCVTFFELCASNLDQNELALHHFMQGEYLMNQGNYALAVLEFQDAIELDPNAPTIHVSISDAYMRLGKIKRAEDHLEIAIELDPNENEAFEMLGQLFVSQKRFFDAEKVFKKLSLSSPDNIDYIFALADLAQIQNEWDLAIDYYIKGYELNNLAINGLEQALQIALTTNKLKRAENICELLLREDPKNIVLLQTMKDLTLFNKNYNYALEILNKIETISGDTPDISIQKSLIYEELNQPVEAIDVVIEYFKKDSQNVDILNRLVTLFIDQNENKKARIYNEKIIDNFPEDPRGFINNAIISMSDKEPETAVSILSPHAEKFSMNFMFNYLLGTAYYQIKDYDNSKDFLLKALSIYPQSRNTKHNLALIYDSSGEWAESDKLYMELISSDSTDAQAYNNYAYSLVERNINIQFALELAKNAIRIAPKSAAYLDTIGWIYYKLKQYDEALGYIKESLVLDSENITIKEHFDEIVKQKAEMNKSKVQQIGAQD